jgi:hypothetical protein
MAGALRRGKASRLEALEHAVVKAETDTGHGEDREERESSIRADSDPGKHVSSA